MLFLQLNSVDYCVKNLVIIVLFILSFVSCEPKIKPFDNDAQKENIQIARYDRLQSRYLTTGDYSALQEMNTEYPIETRTLIEKVLQIGEIIEPDISTKYLRFYQDSILQVLISDTEAEFADMEDLNKDFTKSFSRLHKWLPKIPVPQVYAQIGALEQSVIIGNKSIGICLDKYLGVNYPLYKKYYSYQQRSSMTRAYIVPDGMVFYLLSFFPLADIDKRSQLERDLHMAKIMWITNKAIENKIFKSKYVLMVDNYMRKHKERTVEQLIEDDDYSTLLP